MTLPDRPDGSVSDAANRRTALASRRWENNLLGGPSRPVQILPICATDYADPANLQCLGSRCPVLAGQSLGGQLTEVLAVPAGEPAGFLNAPSMCRNRDGACELRIGNEFVANPMETQLHDI